MVAKVFFISLLLLVVAFSSCKPNSEHKAVFAEKNAKEQTMVSEKSDLEERKQTQEAPKEKISTKPIKTAQIDEDKSVDSLQSKPNVSVPLYSSNPIIAMIDGKPVYLEDIRNKRIHDLLADLQVELERLFVPYAMERVVQNHPKIGDRKIQVTPEEVRTFYELNQLQSQGTFEQLAPQIYQYMEQQKSVEMVQGIYEEALAKGWVSSFIEKPSEFVVTASTETAYIRGSSQAKVMLLEFSDFQCPYCYRVQGTITSLAEQYKDVVVFGYRHFPLSFHTEADEAAIAVECAREQGKFLEMHQLLYQRQRNQTKPELKQYAKELNVANLTAFNQCLDQEKYRSLVNQDIQDGVKLGINGTPGFVIGIFDPLKKVVTGELISGALSRKAFEQKILAYLEKAS